MSPCCAFGPGSTGRLRELLHRPNVAATQGNQGNGYVTGAGGVITFIPNYTTISG